MENRLGNSHGVEIPKKSRSLDLKSLYESEVSKESQNKSVKRKESSKNGGEEKSKKRKKSRKAVSISNLKDIDSSSQKSSNEVQNGGLNDSECSKKLVLGQKSKSTTVSNGISLKNEDSDFRIPRRKRGFVGRNKFEGSQLLKPAGESGNKVGFVSQLTKLTSEDSGTQSESSKVKQKKDIDDHKENSRTTAAQNLKEEDGLAGHSLVNNGDSSLKQSQKHPRKRKDSICVVKEAKPLSDSSVKVCNDLQEDDQENLEENAARMLSSRFDPNCTGFTLNSKPSSASPSANGLPFLSPSDQNYAVSGSKTLSGSESASIDTAARVLRPRNHKEKGSPRKRRHFYEIFPGDLDAYWVVNRKIKVFWPLDQSWYFGLVNDYDKERKLHHVKYDDRDEEWINLQNERFKLLLFPSEAPIKPGRRRSRAREKSSDGGKRNLKPGKEKEKRNLTIEDDSIDGSMDSEPIISWLSRSTHRVKSSPLHSMKRQKISAQSLTSVGPQSICDEAVNGHGCLDGSSWKGDEIKCDFSVSNRSSNSGRIEEPALENSVCPKVSKLPIVYFRRRYRGTGKVPVPTAEANDVGRSVHESVTSVDSIVDAFQDLEELDVCRERLDPEVDLLLANNEGQLQLNISLIHSEKFRFELRFPDLSFSESSPGAENFWLAHAILLLQSGTLMAIWPRVQLEILFIDNIVGLRFLLFEGCLKQAVAFVFQVMMVFYRPDEQGKFADLQLPVTSIRFKFSCSQDLRKQLIFAFCNFHEVKSSKWVFLDSKLKKHCSLARQLPLSECTYDNIQALQNGNNQLLTSPASRSYSSFEGLRRRRSMQGISVMSISRESTYPKLGESSSNALKKHMDLPPFALSFAAAPTFFISLHLRLLMEHSLAHISFENYDSIEQPGSSSSPMVHDNSIAENHLNKEFETSLENSLKASSKDASCDGCLNPAKSELQTVTLSVCSDGQGTSSSSHEIEEVGGNAITPLRKWHQLESEQGFSASKSSIDNDSTKLWSSSVLNGIRVEIPPFDRSGKHVHGELHGTQHSTDLVWNMNGGVIPSPNPTGPRSTWHRNRSSSSSVSYLAHGWSDGKADLFHGNFGNGPKKPRTQVSYSLPFGGLDYGMKNKGQLQKGLPHKRIRRANEKRSSDVSKGSKRNLELLSCDANILVTLGDRGWRECGAQIVLELFDQNEWKLAVKVSGSTRYSYKAHQFLQPGSTNRFTHAMMWKGGKDWILEFPDRSQWALFKEMHEECYNRNIRAASVKNIPIPGVRLIEDYDDNGIEETFVRSSSKYLRQVENDVEMALDTSRVLYDMDSDDEPLISRICNSSEVSNSSAVEISEEIFEKTMDMFEKAAYTQHRDEFMDDEIEELMAGFVPVEVTKIIYAHWQRKRQKREMPLIRHLQPPLWERYQLQLREWELAMSKANSMLPNGCPEKITSIEKPPMFAFCLKPRGLEVPNKGSKQRSQRKISVSGHSNASLGDHDGYHYFGRRSNGVAYGDEKVGYPVHNYESLDDSPLSLTSARGFSPRNAASMGYFSMGSDGFDRSYHQKLQRSKSKKVGSLPSSNDMQMVVSYNHKVMANRNGVHRWSMGFSEWPNQRHHYSDGYPRLGEQLDGSDLDEFKARDAAGAAQHALNIAKCKRERAQRLFHRADLAVHKAVGALMAAEAVKAACEEPNGYLHSDG